MPDTQLAALCSGTFSAPHRPAQVAVVGADSDSDEDNGPGNFANSADVLPVDAKTRAKQRAFLEDQAEVSGEEGVSSDESDDSDSNGEPFSDAEHQDDDGADSAADGAPMDEEEAAAELFRLQDEDEDGEALERLIARYAAPKGSDDEDEEGDEGGAKAAPARELTREEKKQRRRERRERRRRRLEEREAEQHQAEAADEQNPEYSQMDLFDQADQVCFSSSSSSSSSFSSSSSSSSLSSFVKLFFLSSSPPPLYDRRGLVFRARHERGRIGRKRPAHATGRARAVVAHHRHRTQPAHSAVSRDENLARAHPQLQ